MENVQFNQQMAQWLLQRIDRMQITVAEAGDALVVKQALTNAVKPVQEAEATEEDKDAN